MVDLKRSASGAAHPGRRVYSHAVGCNVLPAAVSCRTATRNATPPGLGVATLGRNYTNVPLCHLRAYPYGICSQKITRNMERMTKLARAHAVPHFCGRYKLEFNVLSNLQGLGTGLR